MKKPFCCGASSQHYADYYIRQQKGGEVPYFAGSRYQRGHGLGSMLSGLFRRIIPFVRNNAKTWGSSLLKTGMQVADDVLQGKRIMESAKQRVPEGIKQAARRTKFHFDQNSGEEYSSEEDNRKRKARQSGEGLRWKKKRPTKKPKKTTKRKKKKPAIRTRKSIFD